MGIVENIRSNIGNIIKVFRKKPETTTTVSLSPTTITGPPETGGIITGDPKRDIITPSQEIPKTRRTTTSRRRGRRISTTTQPTPSTDILAQVPTVNIQKELIEQKTQEQLRQKTQIQEAPPSQAQRIDINLPPPTTSTETYNPKTGTFQTSPYGSGAGGTVIDRFPTPDEQRRIIKAGELGDLYGSAITGVPSQMLGGAFTTPMTEEESASITGLSYLNPIKQYEVFKGVHEYEEDIKKSIPIVDKLNTLNTQFESQSETIIKKIDDLKNKNVGENEKWIGSDLDLKKYNDLISEYNKDTSLYSAKYETYSSDPAYQRVINSEERKDMFQRISDSSLPQSKKVILATLVGATDFATFMVPAVRVIRGSDIISTGVVGFGEASNKSGKAKALGHIALGTILVSSGFKGTKSLIPSIKSSTGVLGKVTSTATKTLNVALPVGFVSLYGSDVAKKTGNIGMGIGSALGGLGSMAIGSGAFKRVLPKVRTLEIPKPFGGFSKTKIIGWETKGGKSITLASWNKGKLRIGKQNVIKDLLSMPKGTDIKIGSALETSTLQKSLLELGLEKTTGPKVIEIIPTAKSILRITKGTKSKFIDKELLKTSTERLSESAVKVVLDISKSEGGIVFGSKSRSAQLAQKYNIKGKEFKLIKVPRDIEVRFDFSSDAQMQKITDNTISRFKKLGKQKVNGKIIDLSTAREIKETPYAIEAKLNGNYIKVVEYKGGKVTTIGGESVPEFVVGIKKVGDPVGIGKTKITSLAEELRGVTQGVLRIRKTSGGLIDIGPSPKRMKDIGSVSVSARTLELSKPSSKLKKQIEKFEGFFPESLVREQVKLVSSGTSLIADFSSKTKSLIVISPGSLISASKIISPTNVIFKAPSPKISPYKSPKISPTISPYQISSPKISPYKSPSPRISPTISPYKSPSPKISPTISPYKSPSPKISPYKGYSSYKIPFGYSSLARKRKPILKKPILKKIIKQGFDVYGKPIKQKKYKKLNKVPLTLARARDFGSYIADHSLSTNFKIKESGKPPQKMKARIPLGYYSKVKSKFRDYRISKGKRIPMKDKWIERKGKSRLDTRAEIKKISLLKKLSEIKKYPKIKKKKNKGSNRIKNPFF